MNVVVEHLSVRPFGAATPVLNDVSFFLAKGKTLLVLGPSGSGKSTLMLALAGVIQSMETAEVTGKVEVPASGLLLQNAIDASVGETVFRDVAFGAESAGILQLQISQLVADALAQVGLGLNQDRKTTTLSGGELQRVCLAGLLTLKPSLLLLDEPTSMLDETSAEEVRDAVTAYLKGSKATAVVAEHLFEPWLPLADQLLVLDSTGRVIDQGKPQELLLKHERLFSSWGLWLPGSRPIPEVQQPATGKIFAITGPSGAGKSTLLKEKLKEILVVGPAAEVGWLPQNPALALIGETSEMNAPLPWLSSFGLATKAGQNPFTLSGGEQRRLALAAAFSRDPEFLILDEPTVGQDTKNWLLIVNQILAKRAAGKTIWLATHDPRLIALADEAECVQQKPQPQHKSPTKWRLSPLSVIAVAFVLLVGSLFFSRIGQLGWALASELAVYLSVAALLRGFGAAKALPPTILGLASIFLSNWWLSPDGFWQPALFNALRVAVFVLPSVLLIGSIKPSTLGDQLGQTLKLPARPVVAATAALARLERAQSTWDNLALVRKIRGLTYSSGPIGRLRELSAMTLGMLLDATRGAFVTSVAMEARGFANTDENGVQIKRTWAVLARWQPADPWLILGSFAVLAIGMFLG